MNFNWNCEFAPEGVAIDHFGNEEDDDGGNDRSNFWLPSGRIPLDGIANNISANSWIHVAAAHSASRL